jgi:tRNA pseudouridine38-40 synthase
MFRYRFTAEYLGIDFLGWQAQPQGNSVQQTLERAFGTCLRAKVSITGAGRTDAGVHAEGQVAHFDFPEKFEEAKIEHSVNSLTPDSIFIRRLESCDPEFHARYSALYRHYQYCIARKPTALYGHLVWSVNMCLDRELFLQELREILGTHDFNRFSIPRHDGKSTECHVSRAELEEKGNLLIVHIEADRFLHKMVRSIVGACFDVARKRHAPGLIKAIFTNEFTGEHTWAPSTGLCLKEIGYEKHIY